LLENNHQGLGQALEVNFF